MPSIISTIIGLKLKFKDGIFSFWVLHDSNRTVIFRVRQDMGNNWNAANLRAEQKGIPSRYWNRGEGYATRPADRREIQLWLESHPAYPIVE
jgi:hypothetical protein